MADSWSKVVSLVTRFRSKSVPAGELRADDSEVGNMPDGHPAVSSGRHAARCPFLAQAEEGAHPSRPARPVPLNVIDRTHHPSKATRDLLASIGGRDRLLGVTSRFYPKMFRDKQISLFVRDFDDPHPSRLADWIAEKMSGETYWSSQLRSRPADQPRDRQDAHHHAWNSPKRHRSQFGERFRLDDAIMWMRLMFWSCREEGLDSGPFFDWFQQFIGHFIRVYSSKAPPYVADCVSWSLDPSKIGKYEADGWLMKDVVGMGR
uniref:Uncharacterized protein n=1 Tax=Noctiluca scintillans TaxID=2966 RepID=A0A6T9DHX8_NOCSC|mmetsp:Transcript_51986/g.138596  ORF Transcript_51986/g.138596 Transcript_51986/m.138596 type:complete len:262 (+) Transcript_51986:77-862(+)